jgi:hypothetical protein
MNGVRQSPDKGSVVSDWASGRLKPGFHAVWSPGFGRQAQPIVTSRIDIGSEQFGYWLLPFGYGQGGGRFDGGCPELLNDEEKECG